MSLLHHQVLDQEHRSRREGGLPKDRPRSDFFFSPSLHTLSISFVVLGGVDRTRSEREDIEGWIEIRINMVNLYTVE